MKLLTFFAALTALAATSCTNLGSQIDLDKAGKDAGLSALTTGDITHDPASAKQYRTSEVGLAFGIPFIWKAAEVYPRQSNEAQLTGLGADAKKDGKTALINVKPPEETYYGLPFFIFGLYVDRTEGTGIKK